MAYNKKVTKKEDSEIELKQESAKEVKSNEPIQEEMVNVSKAEFEQMKTQMQMMMQMLSMNNSNSKSEEKKQDRYITFVNMTKGRYVLKGNSFYTIENQFEHRKFIEKEARIIVNNMPNSIKEGKVYILDADFVKECDLDGVYETLLNDKEMIELLNREPSYVAEVYKNACPGQKRIIVDMLENKKLNNEKIDANILMEIGKLSGKDLINIEPIDME